MAPAGAAAAPSPPPVGCVGQAVQALPSPLDAAYFPYQAIVAFLEEETAGVPGVTVLYDALC
jgi:hypothetical protein